jgi:hypothetical protein
MDATLQGEIRVTLRDVIDIALPHTGWKPRAHQKKL